MKKVMFLIATVLIGGMMLTGCKKPEPTPTPTPDPEPTPTTYTIEYKVTNTNSHLTMSPCFNLDLTYVDANGQSVTENNVTTFPWSKKIEVTSPFQAKLEGKFNYNETELPDEFVFGACRGIGVYDGGSLVIDMVGALGELTKENFFRYIEEHPDRLQFTVEREF